MATICRWCKQEVAEGVRYCVWCGHKMTDEAPSPESTALTDLKDCFGSFPLPEIIHCYVCADQDRCADLALSKQLLGLHQDLSALNAELKTIRKAAGDLEDSLVALRGAINEGFQRTYGALSAINSSINRSTRIG